MNAKVIQEGSFKTALETGQLLTTVAKGTSVAFLGIVLGKGLGFSVHVLLARNMTAGDYGVFSLAYSIFIILTNIALLGMPTGVLRYCSFFRSTMEMPQVRGTIITGYTLVLINAVGFVWVILTFGLDFFQDIFFHPNFNNTLRVFVLLIPLYAFNRLTWMTMRAFKFIFVHVGLKDLAMHLIFVCILLSLFLHGFSLQNVTRAYAVAVTVVFLLSVMALFVWVMRPLRLFVDVSFQVKRFVRFSVPIFVITVSYLLLNQISKIVLGYFGTPEDVAVFNVAMNLSVLIVIFLNGIEVMFAPIMSELYALKRQKEIEYLFRTCTRWVFTFCVPLMGIFILFGGDLMAMFGEHYRYGAGVLLILIVGYFVNAITGPVALLMQMSGHQDVDFFNIVPAVILNFVLCAYLVEAYSVWGAALGMAGTIILLNVVRIIEVYWLLRIQPYDLKYVKPVMAFAGSLILYIVCEKIVSGGLWYLWGGGFIVSYFIILFALGLEQDDRALCMRIKEKFLP